jgi:hypothetical protein
VRAAQQAEAGRRDDHAALTQQVERMRDLLRDNVSSLCNFISSCFIFPLWDRSQVNAHTSSFRYVPPELTAMQDAAAAERLGSTQSRVTELEGALRTMSAQHDERAAVQQHQMAVQQQQYAQQIAELRRQADQALREAKARVSNDRTCMHACMGKQTADTFTAR